MNDLPLLQNSLKTKQKCLLWNLEKPLTNKIRYSILQYLSPEALSGKEFGVKSDIWSFGIFTLKVAENRIPYKDERSKDISKLVFVNKPPTLVFKEWTSDFKSMNRACLQHNVTGRPSALRVLNFRIFKKVYNPENFGNYVKTLA